MKKIIFYLVVLMVTCATNAQTVNTDWQQGHRGLDFKIGAGYGIGLGDAKGADMLMYEAGIGKRLDNMYFGLSSGAWMAAGDAKGSDAIIPILFGYDMFMTKGRFCPTLAFRVGYGINTAEDISIGKEKIKMPNFLLVQAMPGMSLAVSRTIDLNLSAGLTGMTSVGGTGSSGTNVYLSVGASLTFHKSTKPKAHKEKEPTRERGVQMTLEGGVLGFSGDDDAYSRYKGGQVSFAFTYRFNHKLSAGFGFGGDIATPSSGYGLLDVNGGEARGRMYSLEMREPVRMFLRGQYNLNEKRFSPFVSCDAGLRIYDYEISAFADNLTLGEPSKMGFYAEPAVGFSLRTTNNTYLDLKVGYSFAPEISSKKLETMDDGGVYHAEERGSIKVSAPFVSIGIKHTFGFGQDWFK